MTVMTPDEYRKKHPRCATCKYFVSDGEIEECITDSISFILTKWVDNEYYRRAINVCAICTVKDEIYYL